MTVSTFKANIITMFGEQGATWLKTLPMRIEHCARIWHLSHLQPMTNLTYHYAMSGLMSHQQKSIPIILKIGIDLEIVENEAHCLQYFGGHGCIKMLAYEASIGAILLEHAIPGNSLKQYFPNQEAQAIHATSQVIQALRQVPRPTSTNFPTIADWLKPLNDAWDLPAPYLEKARDLQQALLSTQGAPILLHGDLHHDNILSYGKSWIAIDPKGVIGEIDYEIGAYLRNPIPDLNHHPDARKIIHQRIHAFSAALQLDPQRLASWNYVQAVLSACWMIADNLSPQPFLDYLAMIASDPLYPPVL